MHPYRIEAGRISREAPRRRPTTSSSRPAQPGRAQRRGRAESASERARLDRAEEHYRSFGRIWEDYLSERPHVLDRTVEEDRTVVASLRRAISLPAEWTSYVGRLRDLPLAIIQAFEAIQPYQAQIPDWNALPILHDLARVDRPAHPMGSVSTSPTCDWAPRQTQSRSRVQGARASSTTAMRSSAFASQMARLSLQKLSTWILSLMSTRPMFASRFVHPAAFHPGPGARSTSGSTRSSKRSTSTPAAFWTSSGDP